MLVLLPPSEGKTAPRRGKPLDLAALSHPELTAARAQVVDALVALSAGAADTARDALGLSEGQAGELARNAALRTAPTARASAIYTGVLYERLRLPELPLRARRRVLIASALWGVVAPDDRIPAYKLSMGAKLPGIGGLATHWRPVLRAALPDRGLVVDLRSGPYAAAWAPEHATVVTVRAFTERAGKRSAISHMVKATRGEVARLLLEAPRPPRDAEGVAALVAASGREVELTGRTSVDVIYRMR